MTTDKEDYGRESPDVPARHVTGEGAAGQTPRLVVSWLIVGLPLAYGIYQTISRTLPLFGG